LGEISAMQLGAVKGLHLVVADIQQARQTLADRGVEVGEVNDLGASSMSTSVIPMATHGSCRKYLLISEEEASYS
jgi:hypothetical protein